MIEVYGRQIPPDTKFADLHFHTSRSFDTHHGMTPKEAVTIAGQTNLSAIAITDHDSIAPAHEALNFASRRNLNLQIVIGEEITTDDGHLVGLFLTDKVQEHISLEATIYQIHRQGGLAVAPHPFCRVPMAGKAFRSLNQNEISRIIDNPDPEVYFDGFEVFSMGASELYKRKQRRSWTDLMDSNMAAQVFYAKNRDSLGAPIASSDGHRLSIGRASVGYRGDLFDSLKAANTLAVHLNNVEQWDLSLKSLAMFGGKRGLPDMAFEDFRRLVLGY